MSNNEMPMKQMIESALSKIREVVDVNTVIGEPMHISDDVTIIPFSKVAVGFASGGTEYPATIIRANGEKENITLNVTGLTDAEREIILLGGLINYYRSKNNG